MRVDEMKKAIEDAGYGIMPPRTEAKELLDLSGLSLREWSAKSGVCVPRLCRWSRGEEQLRAEQMQSAMRVLLAAVIERRARIDALVSEREAVTI